MKETSKAPKKVKEKPAEAMQEITTPSIASTSEETTTRYPDADLEEFRILIEEKIAKARLELQFLQGQLRGVDEKGEDNAERHLSIEDGSATMELEQTGSLAARQIQFINNLENALLRIRNKTMVYAGRQVS